MHQNLQIDDLKVLCSNGFGPQFERGGVFTLEAQKQASICGNCNGLGNVEASYINGFEMQIWARHVFVFERPKSAFKSVTNFLETIGQRSISEGCAASSGTIINV